LLPGRAGDKSGHVRYAAESNRLCRELLTGLQPQSLLLADRGYDADWIRALVNQQGAWASIPPKRNRKRFFNKIKQCRRIATRYDKRAANYPPSSSWQLSSGYVLVRALVAGNIGKDRER